MRRRMAPILFSGSLALPPVQVALVVAFLALWSALTLQRPLPISTVTPHWHLGLIDPACTLRQLAQGVAVG